MTYRPCVSGAISGNSSTFDSITHLPYKRPCSELCTFIPTSCTFPASDELSSISYEYPNCTGIDKNTSLPIFDSSNNSSRCNSLSSINNKTIVSSTTENYIGESCHGILNTFYNIDGPSVNSSLSSLLFPYALQNFIDPQLKSAFKQIPSTISATCITSLKRIICSTAYPAVGNYTILDFLVAVPRFPEYSDCITYRSECAYIIKQSPRLDLNCSETKSISGTVIHIYPSKTQIVTYALGTIPVYSEPFSTSSLGTTNYSTDCPNGFSIPPDGSNAPGQVAVTDGCALNCPSPIYGNADQNLQNAAELSSAILNTLFCGLSLFNIYNQHPDRRNLLLAVGTGALFSYYLWDAMQRIIVVNPSKLVCKSITEWHTMTIPSKTTETGNNALLSRNCNFYALLKLYMEFIFHTCVILIFIELWFKITQRLDIRKYRKIYFSIGILLAVMNGLLVSLYNYPVMFRPGAPNNKCEMTSASLLTDFYLRYMIHCIFYGISFFPGAHILWTLWKIRGKSTTEEESSLTHIWHSESVVLLYLPVFILFFAPIDFWYGIELNVYEADRMKDSTVDWITCIFDNYYSSADQTLVDNLCGVRPRFTIPTTPDSVMVLILFIFFNAFTALITFDDCTILFWRRTLGLMAKPSLLDNDIPSDEVSNMGKKLECEDDEENIGIQLVSPVENEDLERTIVDEKML